MLNPFVLKKWGALIFVGMLSNIMFQVGSATMGVLGGIGLGFFGILIGTLIGSVLLNNPFTLLLEGKGILAIDMSSTGILRPFIVKVQSPYITGKLDDKVLCDVFDRSTVMSFANPQEASEYARYKEDGSIEIKLDSETLNSARFGMFHYPVLIWNSQINSVITKDFFSEIEKQAFAEHGILYLNRKVEDLTNHIRDFGRYIVEQLKPKTSFLNGNFMWIIVIVFVIIMLVLFGKPMIQAISGFAAPIGKAASTAGMSAVTARG